MGQSSEVQKTLTNTFITVGLMVGITGVVSYFSLGLQLGLMTYLACFVASFALIFATRKFSTGPIGLVMLAAFAGFQGVTLGPLLTHYLAMTNGTSIISTAAGLTAAGTFACAMYAISSRRDFSRMGGFLMAGTVVLIVASLISMFFPVPLVQVTISAVGALLFMGWLLYEVGAIVNGDETNYINASLGIFLSVLNLFISLLRIVGFLQNDD
jgi:modulator of FtsH protease